METFDHIIVGGGVVGASIAYHLKRKSAGTVLLLERNGLASAASSRAAGLILQASTKYSNTPLAKMTTQVLPVLEDEVGESVGYHSVGSLRIAASDERVAELDAMVEDALKWDIPVELPRETEIRSLVPWLDTSTILKSVFFQPMDMSIHTL
ncbi:MAG: FAD-dependent oxidoreductase [Gammaproteobacteria bacterium]|nr:FAD-dependent oxidoreductase [Gammaproteobacteria bacterium]